MAHHRKVILQRRLKQKLAALRRSVNRLKLWLDLKGPEPILLPAPADLRTKLTFPYEGIHTSRPYNPFAVATHRCSDLVVRFAERPDHRERNRQRPDARPVSRGFLRKAPHQKPQIGRA